MNIALWWNKLLAAFRVRSMIGGLEISDTVLRFAYFNGTEWQMTGLRLPPGIIEHGRIKEYAEFVEALKVLKKRIVGIGDPRKKLNAVASLSSVNIYTQVFSLPLLEGNALEKAIQLNVQMVSPEDVSQTYSGWQIVGEEEKSLRTEILSAFINREIVDEIKRSLDEAGFVVYSVESRALSLARLIRFLGRGFDLEQSYILLNLDSNGIEFLVIRRGQLYFQYFNSWTDLEVGEHQITQAAFEAAVVRNLHQVMNFYHSHWSEPMTEILLSASAFEDQIQKIISNNFSLQIRPLSLNADPPVSPDWFVALGAGVRGLVPPKDDQDITLLGTTARQEFHRHQVVRFMRFWRTLTPVALATLLFVLLGADLFLMRMERDVGAQVAQSNVFAEQAKEVEVLRSRVQNFNRLVGLIQGATAVQEHPDERISRIFALFAAQGATIDRIGFGAPEGAVSLDGRIGSESQLLNLKRALDTHPEIQSVDLPLTRVRKDDQGVIFSMSFVIAPSKTE